MVFSDAEEIEADLIGQRTLLDNLTKRFGLRQLSSMFINSDISKRVEPQFEAPAARVWRGGVEFDGLRHLGALSLGMMAAPSQASLRAEDTRNKLYTLSSCAPAASLTG